MTAADASGGNGELLQARETIARHEGELERLRAELANQRFAADLSEALKVAATAGLLGSPLTHERLLELIVETAVHVVGAGAGSLLLLSPDCTRLVFEVAVGAEADELEDRSVPLEHGIEGLVVTSGQPLAVSDADADPRVAEDVARLLGYRPKNILCVPLAFDDQPIGVLELLDKRGADAFGTDDIEALTLFAKQATIAIRLSRTYRNFTALVGDLLETGGEQADHRPALAERADVLSSQLEQDETYRQVRELAELVHEISGRGEDELAACRALLQGFADYLRSQPVVGLEV